MNRVEISVMRVHVWVTFIGFSTSPPHSDCRGILNGLHVGFRLFLTTYVWVKNFKNICNTKIKINPTADLMQYIDIHKYPRVQYSYRIKLLVTLYYTL